MRLEIRSISSSTKTNCRLVFIGFTGSAEPRQLIGSDGRLGSTDADDGRLAWWASKTRFAIRGGVARQSVCDAVAENFFAVLYLPKVTAHDAALL
jgi:hypothetical protein